MTKNEIRKLFLEKRKSLAQNDFEGLEQSLFRIILDSFNFSEKVVHVFLSIAEMNEIDTFKLMEMINARDSQTTWVVPKCEKNCILDHFYFDKETTLEKSAYGIPEPLNAKRAQEKDIDIVLVPLLAADKNGNRIGYGKGFYDRFLTKCKPPTIFIGLSIFEPLEQTIETNEHDVPLHYLASPERTLKIEHE